MVLAIALLNSVVVMAQQEEGTLTTQAKVGMNVAGLSDADKSVYDLNFGLETEYMVTDNFSLAAGIIMSNQGAKYDNEVEGKYEVDLDYVNIPIMANFYVLPGLAVKAGVQPGFRLKAKVKAEGVNEDWDEYYSKLLVATGGMVDVSGLKIKRYDLCFPVGLSYEYKNIVLDARYNWGLIKLMNIGDAFYNRVFQVTLGYKFSVDL